MDPSQQLKKIGAYNYQRRHPQYTSPAVLDSGLTDTWSWNHAKQGAYTCANGYFWRLKQQRDWDDNCNMSWIWRLN